MEQRSVNVRKTALFVGITYAVSWALIGLYLALGGRWVQPGATVIAVVYMFVPGTAALIVQGLIYRQSVAGPLGISFRLNRWWLVGWLSPPLLVLGAIGISLLMPGASYDPGATDLLRRMRDMLPPEQYRQAAEQIRTLPIFWISLFGGLLAGITVNAIAGLGEELGWRGLLQRELGPLGFWRSSALIGLIWGVWHAPIILQGHNYPEHPVIGVAMMTVLTVLLAPILSLVRLKARSVIAAAILHGTFNAVAGLTYLVVSGGSDLTVGITGLAGMIVLALANVVIFFYLRTHPVESVPQA